MGRGRGVAWDAPYARANADALPVAANDVGFRDNARRVYFDVQDPERRRVRLSDARSTFMRRKK